MTSFVTALPKEISASVLVQWCDLPTLCKFDSAITSKMVRPPFMQVITGRVVYDQALRCCDFHTRASLKTWLLSRCLMLPSFVIGEGDSDLSSDKVTSMGFPRAKEVQFHQMDLLGYNRPKISITALQDILSDCHQVSFVGCSASPKGHQNIDWMNKFLAECAKKTAWLLENCNMTIRSEYFENVEWLKILGSKAVTSEELFAISEKCSRLRTLGLNVDQISSSAIGSIGRLGASLRELELFGSSGRTVVTADVLLDIIEHCPSLARLTVQCKCKLGDGFFELLPLHGGSLQRVSLRECKADSAAGMRGLFSLPSLTHAEVNNMFVYDRAGRTAVLRFMQRVEETAVLTVLKSAAVVTELHISQATLSIMEVLEHAHCDVEKLTIRDAHPALSVERMISALSSLSQLFYLDIRRLRRPGIHALVKALLGSSATNPATVKMGESKLDPGAHYCTASNGDLSRIIHFNLGSDLAEIHCLVEMHVTDVQLRDFTSDAINIALQQVSQQCHHVAALSISSCPKLDETVLREVAARNPVADLRVAGATRLSFGFLQQIHEGLPALKTLELPHSPDMSAAQLQSLLGHLQEVRLLVGSKGLREDELACLRSSNVSVCEKKFLDGKTLILSRRG